MKYLLSAFCALFIFASFTSCAQQKKQSAVLTTSENLTNYSKATFASGCFWCVEAAFESVKGVKEAVSGYSGGAEKNPTYQEVGGGSTGHAEAVEVYYDPKVVSYETLLKVYFGSMDPTQVNGQGPDRGKQYRSIVFYRTGNEKTAVENSIKELNATGKYKSPISVEVMPLTKFWEAEGYHQNYVKNNPNVPYVRGESVPRIKRFQAQYPELIKQGEKY